MATKTPISDLQQHKGQGGSAATAPSTEHEPKKSDEISLLDLLIVLGERKGTIFRVTLAFAIIAIVVSLFLPKRYTAMVTLLPPQQNSSSMSAALMSQLSTLGGMGGVAALAGNSLGLKNPNEMYVGMLKSRTVEDAMVQNFGLMNEYRSKYPSDARKAFEKHATVNGNGKDGLIHISVEDRDPNRAAQLANGYVDQYRKLSAHLAITEASQRRLFFEQQLEQAKNNLADAEESLKRTEQTTGVIELTGQARALIQSAMALRAQIAAKEVQIQGMQSFATGQNAQLVQARQELDALRMQLAKLAGAEDASSDELIVPKGKVTGAGLEYVRKLRDVKYYETIFEILAKQFEIAKLDEAKEGALIQVVDQAIPPDRRSFPKRALIVIGATVLGLFFGALLALFQAGVERMKEDREVALKLYHLGHLLSFKATKAS
jgi:uncharacterized protein involved in exopolysaccharide biosynthesis